MITLYTTGCPRCRVLEERLKKNGIYFELSKDVDALIDKGFESAPVLKINDQFFSFKDAMTLLREYEQGMVAEFGLEAINEY